MAPSSIFEKQSKIIYSSGSQTLALNHLVGWLKDCWPLAVSDTLSLGTRCQMKWAGARIASLTSPQQKLLLLLSDCTLRIIAIGKATQGV